MIEKHLVLNDADPAVFYGVNNTNLQVLKALFPKLRIVARGNVIRVMGDEDETSRFEQAVRQIEMYCAKYNSLKEEVIVDIVNGDVVMKDGRNWFVRGPCGKVRVRGSLGRPLPLFSGVNALSMASSDPKRAYAQVRIVKRYGNGRSE